ncbi:MAG: MBL fold metallo-hydrolase [Bryobacteraceae bacterium]
MLASSSSGNSTYVGTERTRLLVDAGLSRKEIFARLAAIGEDPYTLDAILVTHEHSDHISGLPALARTLKNVPIFLSRLTAPQIDWSTCTPVIEEFQAGAGFAIGEIAVDTFTIPHDAVDPVGFCFHAQGIKVGVATDLGYIPDSIRVHLRGCQVLVLESNHDLEMLKVGPYPWSVKQRVMGRKGHLSNDSVSEFIRDGLDSSTETLILGHLSEHNNHPEIVRLMGAQALEQRALATRLIVAEPRRQCEALQF